ncbi:MAG: hypothetical protein H6Q94_862, partial [Nitrospirae bacterium]|nr:hypothetical protein [Nitrospirota bacterium]
QNKVGYSIRADFFADIPTVCFPEIKRQKPRSSARMSESTIFRLILTIVYELYGIILYRYKKNADRKKPGDYSSPGPVIPSRHLASGD